LFLLHHEISPFSELHKNLLYLLWHSKFEGNGIQNLRVKKCAPSLFSLSVVGHFTPKWLGKHAHSKQRKAFATQPLQFHVKFYVDALVLVQHL